MKINSDYSDLLRLFDECGVRYVIASRTEAARCHRDPAKAPRAAELSARCAHTSH